LPRWDLRGGFLKSGWWGRRVAERKIDCPDGHFVITVLSAQKLFYQDRVLQWNGLSLVSDIKFQFEAGGNEDEVVSDIVKRFNGKAVSEINVAGDY
jgi:hypothetical protein